MLKLLCRKLIKFWTEFFNTNQLKWTTLSVPHTTKNINWAFECVVERKINECGWVFHKLESSHATKIK